MQYLEVIIRTSNNETFREELIANLLMAGFNSFEENPQGVIAYIEPAKLNLPALEVIIASTGDEATLESINNLPEQNWNILWESNYEPVVVDEQCIIRAPFHQAPAGILYDIVIQPKMSFGTAHHATTQLMIRTLLGADFKGKSVLDMGSGTGVLAILAAMKGAATVVAIDNDEWAFENALENCQRNEATNVQVILGDAKAIPDKKFDVILANINRNVLLNDLKAYDNHLTSQGMVMLSGFYEDDAEMIISEALRFDWELKSKQVMENWVALCFLRSSLTSP
ncbi:MAG: 50S ribosomal protein L11 methyltransferase [Bacteroidales bacterium]|nr:50S ribosomal protein L11 methyltransferase [Bacteroidales bacterium]MDZ4205541.1 50S ribosomal protein L11 methyltransferase [Bacteroidales bacterium]